MPSSAAEKGTSSSGVPENKFTLTEALNKPGFVTFLAQYEAAHGTDLRAEIQSGGGDLEKVYGSFTESEQVKKDIFRMAREDNSFIGIKLEDTDLESISIYINEMSIKDPEMISKLKLQMELVASDRDEIKEKETKIKRLVAEKTKTIKENSDSKIKKYESAIRNGDAKKVANEILKEKGEVWSKRLSPSGYWFESSAKEFVQLELDAIKADAEGQAEKAGLTTDVTRQIEELSTEKEKMDAQYSHMRGILLKEVDIDGKVSKIAQDKVREKIDALLATPEDQRTLKDIDKEQAMLLRVQKTKEARGDEFEYLNDSDTAAFESKLTVAAEKAVTNEIEKEIAGLKLDRNPYANLKTKILPYFKRDSIGTNDAEAVKTLVLDVLEKKHNSHGRAKAFLITHLVEDLKTLS